MRGLKQAFESGKDLNTVVASFTDAWIETLITAFCSLFTFVASFTDAWIETNENTVLHNEAMSHLLQMRGLKRSVPLQSV